MTLGTTLLWSGTPLKAGLSPAAAHLQAAASASLRSEGQTLHQKKYRWALGQAFSFLFFLAERWHDVGHNVIMIWHAVEGRAEPCRGAFTGCRLCRRAPKLKDLMTGWSHVYA